MLLSNADFLLQLAALFTSRQSSGSVFLTQKRHTYEAPVEEDGDAVMASGSGAVEEGEREYPCLVRATDGSGNKRSKVKISTLVQPADYLSFSTSYGTLLKASMSSLRKKRKSKRKPEAKKSKDSKSKPAFVLQLPKVVGPRRGAGHGKRQKSIKRRDKALEKLGARRKRDEVAGKALL